MSTFKNHFSYGVIKEVGEDDVLVSINGQEVEIPLDDSNKKVIFDAVEEGIFIVPVDLEKRQLLMNIDTPTLYEVFPETDLEELAGATDELPDDEEV